MNNQENGFVIGRIKSLKFAIKGFWLLMTTEHSIMVQMAIGVLMSLVGWWLDISATEWILQVLAIGLVRGVISVYGCEDDLPTTANPNMRFADSGHLSRAGVVMYMLD